MAREWTFINDNDDRTDYDEARLDYLAKRWSELHDAAERQHFSRMADMEDGRDYEPDECNVCGGPGVLGVNHPTLWRSSTVALASIVNCPHGWDGRQHTILYGITCTDCDGDGYDKTDEREAVKRQAAQDAEIEIIERMLHDLGARMMRPYEHWNEDERYMEYMERDR